MRTPPKVMPALVTPFDSDGILDLAAHRHNVSTLAADEDVAGFVLGGSTGQGPYLEPGERWQLVAEARATVGDRRYLVCGVMAESVRMAATQIEEAALGGADAVLVATPTTSARGNHDAVVRFYTVVADLSPLPVLLYSVPAMTGYELPVENVGILAELPNIVGIKDSGGRPVRIQELKRTIAEPFVMYAGASRTLAPSMAAGGHGAITASANYVHSLVAAIVDAAESSQAEAEERQHELTAIVHIVESHGLPGTMAAARAAGLRPGTVRLPLVGLEASALDQVSQAVEAVRSVTRSAPVPAE